MPKDDMSKDVGRWLPDEGWYDLEIVSMKSGESKLGNPKYVVSFALASEPQKGIIQDMTNIPGKRWLLRQMLEACGIEGAKNKKGEEIFDWDVSDVEGKTVCAKIVHDKTPWINRDNETVITPKAKVAEFKKISVGGSSGGN